ncbi:aspartate kinase [Archaeoglobus sulfaticallidus PM70-1]|uniref:Aspartokinase n=1 Tax=Archaeoglobus sulfaticallidus PM70-1 TaxID=387631 RepID=N0BLL5_9EURY|nr:aspartate kinase [Archaeoglobus sulfaticallidus]AGK61431.1 aspartate kinase [Archaeoglobus sulfaticallidus PM70-1]
MRVVMKFGGTSVKDGESILHVANLIKKFEDYEKVVVVSAMAGVTDSLIEAAKKCYKEPSSSFIKLFIAELTKKHYEAISTAVKDPQYQNKAFEVVDKLLDELEKVLMGIGYLGELTRRSEDYIVSFGERLVAPILSSAILSLGVDSVALTGGDAGIITDNNFGRAKPKPEVYNLINSRLDPLLRIKKTTPVITGFIGVTDDGSITTLGRGGSDLTATLIASALNADEVWLWKEVDGVLTTDPKIVPEARLIPEISYQEAMELSHFGAKILHPRAIEPVMRKEIPVRIKNTFNPDAEGTVIMKGADTTKDIVKALSLIEKVAIVNVSGAGFDFAEIMSDVFSRLAKEKVNVIMVAQSSSELNLSIVVDESDIEVAYSALKPLENGVVSVRKMKDIAVVSAVGAGMAGTPGVAGRIFSALGKNGINVIMISQSCSEYNVSFTVSKNEGKEAVRVLHREFELHKSPEEQA